MRSTLYAAFKDIDMAEKATGALLDHGLSPEDISLIANTPEDELLRREEARRAAFTPTATDDIENNEVTGTSYGHAVVSDTGASTTQPGQFPSAGSNMAYGADMAGGIQSTDAATHYAGGDNPFRTDAGAPTEAGRHSSYTVVPPASVVDSSTTAIDRPELSAKSGITTTTGADAGAGAAKGAAVGLGVGVLAALAAVFIPGIGLVVGAGALALATAGAVGATGAGAIAGGVMGFLKDQGIPDEALTVYREAFEHGGAILAVNVPPDKNRADIEAVLAKYGAQNIDMYGEVHA